MDDLWSHVGINVFQCQWVWILLSVKLTSIGQYSYLTWDRSNWYQFFFLVTINQLIWSHLVIIPLWLFLSIVDICVICSYLLFSGNMLALQIRSLHITQISTRDRSNHNSIIATWDHIDWCMVTKKENWHHFALHHVK